jgi:hypothetical protein
VDTIIQDVESYSTTNFRACPPTDQEARYKRPELRPHLDKSSRCALQDRVQCTHHDCDRVVRAWSSNGWDNSAGSHRSYEHCFRWPKGKDMEDVVSDFLTFSGML